MAAATLAAALGVVALYEAQQHRGKLEALADLQVSVPDKVVELGRALRDRATGEGASTADTPDASTPETVIARVPRVPPSASSAGESQTALSDGDTALPVVPVKARPFGLAGPAYALNRIDHPGTEADVAVAVIVAGEGDVDPGLIAPMPIPLAVGVRAGRPDDTERAEAFWRQGREVVALLPMEDMGGRTFGPGTIRAGQGIGAADENASALLSRVQTAVAAMRLGGGRAIRDGDTREGLLRALGRHGFGFVARGRGVTAFAAGPAQEAGLPYASVTRRLPMAADAELTKRALTGAVRAARAKGWAVVVVPPTPDALRGVLRWSLERTAGDAALVPLSILLDRPSRRG